MAVTSPESSPLASSSHWLYGRGVDVLVGCCGIYSFSIPLLLAMTATTGLQTWSISLTIILGVTINAPHYGATLVRLYEREQDRRKYVFFTVYTTLALVALFVVATRNLWLASALITAYVTWSPWHFSAQNYGLLVMFMRREGISFDDTTKRLFYASFVFSTLMSIEGVQAVSSDLVFAPATFRAPDTPQVFQWSLLQDNAVPLLWTTGLLYVGTLGTALVRLRDSGFRVVGPAMLLIVTQALFTAIPVAAGRIYTHGEINLAFAPVWISMAHSAQYLWVSAYFAKRSDARQGTARFLGKSFLAGSGITVLPALLFAPQLLGDRAWDAGLAGLVFSMVNLHHFIMDGAIWKLRDGRVSNILLRSNAGSEERSTSTDPPQHRRLPIAIWTACGLSVVVPVVHLYESEIDIPSARTREDIDRALNRIRLVGRESIGLYRYVGSEYSRLQQPELAIEHFKLSLDVYPTADAWTDIGNEYRHVGDGPNAQAAYDAALELDPDFLGALLGNAASLAFGDTNASVEQQRRAHQLLEHALSLHPGQADALKMLSQLPETGGR